jgi:hypothetical protein
MKERVNILYIHGMGGGSESRIPSILKEALASDESVRIIVRTYDFDPEIASCQIALWIDELRPSLIIGESLGSIHALRFSSDIDVPCLLVSPALNTPLYFGLLCWLAFIPGVTAYLDRIYKPEDGDRQKLHFTFSVLRKYLRHRRRAFKSVEGCLKRNPSQRYFAFFGTLDHYRKSGIVSVRTWKKHFGNSFELYEGTHFMEDEYVLSMLLPKLCMMLNDKK